MCTLLICCFSQLTACGESSTSLGSLKPDGAQQGSSGADGGHSSGSLNPAEAASAQSNSGSAAVVNRERNNGSNAQAASAGGGPNDGLIEALGELDPSLAGVLNLPPGEQLPPPGADPSVLPPAMDISNLSPGMQLVHTHCVNCHMVFSDEAHVRTSAQSMIRSMETSTNPMPLYQNAFLETEEGKALRAFLNSLLPATPTQPPPNDPPPEMVADPALAGLTIRREAEDLNLTGYRGERFFGAGGNRVASLRPARRASGMAQYTHEGEPGFYFLSIRYFDENDGNALLKISHSRLGSLTEHRFSGNDEMFHWFRWDQTVELQPGDVLTFEGQQEAQEYARWDQLLLVPAAAMAQ